MATDTETTNDLVHVVFKLNKHKASVYKIPGNDLHFERHISKDQPLFNNIKINGRRIRIDFYGVQHDWILYYHRIVYIVK